MAENAARRTPMIAAAPWLDVLPPAVRLAFYGGAAARAAASPAWGVAFAEEACRAHADGTRATLWLGPDEYLLLDFADALPDATAAFASVKHATGEPQRAVGTVPNPLGELQRALGDLPHALVDVSHRQFALRIQGPHAELILRGACPLDLDLREFPVGMCTRTVFAKADIVLWRSREDAFHLEIWRSFAGYVTGVLREIAAEFYL